MGHGSHADARMTAGKDAPGTRGPRADDQAGQEEDHPSTRDAGEALLRVAGLLEELITALAAEHGLTAFQARTLRALHDTSSQSALADQLGCSASRVSVVTGELEERGLVRRAASSGDRRMRVTRPTEEGSRVVDAIGEELGARSPLGRLTGGEVAELFRLLTAVESASDR